MSKTYPNILVEYVDKNTYKTNQVVEASGIWAVFYDGKPINIKTSHFLNEVSPKYKKTSFSNPGHAINLCKKMNSKFKTNRFTVVSMVGGSIIHPNE